MIKRIFLILLLYGGLSAGDLNDLITFIQNADQGVTIEHGFHSCGFSQMAEVKLRYNEFDPVTQSMADRLLSVDETQISIISPAGHFAIHYDTSGFHAVESEDVSGNGIPDFIDSAGVILDHVWDVEINRLGFRKPLNSIGRPTERYHVYFQNLSGVYGQTVLVNRFIGEDGSSQWSSYIEMDNDFSAGFYTKGLDALRVTAAHEFNHAIQLAYNLRYNGQILDLFLMEMSSTWMEDYVYDDINDYYQYLDDSGGLFDGFYNFSFHSPYGTDPYANCLFLHLTEKEYGVGINVRLWDAVVDTPAISALDQVLKEKGGSFAAEQNQYAAWLYFTGNRAVSGEYFPEAADYPEVEIMEKPLQFEFDMNAMGMRLFKLPIEKAGYYQSSLRSTNSDGMYNHINGNRLTGAPVHFNHNQAVPVENDENVLVVLSNPTSKTFSNINYGVSRAGVSQFPNPVSAHRQGAYIVFQNVYAGATIRIFDVLGRRVKTLNVEGGGPEVRWNIRSEAGLPLSSGMYFYHVLAPGVNMAGKITIVN